MSYPSGISPVEGWCVMTIDADTHIDGAPPPQRLTLALAALVLAHGGVVKHRLMVDIAERWAVGRRTPNEWVHKGTRGLRADGVLVRHGDTWYAPSLADLGAWVADGLAAREDAGYHDDPVVPVTESRAA